jgi:putative chitinase
VANKLTLDQLMAIYKEGNTETLKKFLPFLNATFDEFGLDTQLQRCMFLAQVGHESGQLRYVKELASGAAYEGRQDLGNTSPGDGVRYKGRGLIQITGKRNYVLCSLALDLPLLENPQLLEEPHNAVRSAGWFWTNENLSALGDNLDAVSDRINRGHVTKKIGDSNGYADRLKLYERAKKVLM